MLASLRLSLLLVAYGAHGQEKFRGRLDSAYLPLQSKGRSSESCKTEFCGCCIKCSYAYDVSRGCYQVTFPLQLLKWFGKKILIKDASMTLYYNNHNSLLRKKPRVLWLLDNVSKGRNFGTAGSALDLPVDGVSWWRNEWGPRSWSPLLYGRGKHSEKVALNHNGKLLLDMLSQFTISMWVKTDYHNGEMMLLGAYPFDATRFSFGPSKYRNQLTLALNSYGPHTHTTTDSRGLVDWRHVAVVYRPYYNTVFFLNGKVWQTLKDPFVSERVRPTHLYLWNSGDNAYPFRGNLACVAIFQAALSRSEINIFQDNCP